MPSATQDCRSSFPESRRTAARACTLAAGDADRVSAPPEGQSASPDDAARRIAELEAELAALQAEAERGRQLLDAATDYAVITMNPDGRVTGWNAGARTILGYEEAEILGRSGEVFFPAEDRSEGVFVRELCRAMEEGRALNERWHLKRDGSRFWASGSMMPLLDGEGYAKGFLNVFRDNTAVQAKEERRALLLAEMGHRVKNTLATVQAVAILTLGRAVPSDVREMLTARLLALARSHDMLFWSASSCHTAATTVRGRAARRCGCRRTPWQRWASPSTSWPPMRPSTVRCRFPRATSRSAGAWDAARAAPGWRRSSGASGAAPG